MRSSRLALGVFILWACQPAERAEDPQTADWQRVEAGAASLRLPKTFQRLPFGGLDGWYGEWSDADGRSASVRYGAYAPAPSDAELWLRGRSESLVDSDGIPGYVVSGFAWQGYGRDPLPKHMVVAYWRDTRVGPRSPALLIALASPRSEDLPGLHAIVGTVRFRR